MHQQAATRGLTIRELGLVDVVETLSGERLGGSTVFFCLDSYQMAFVTYKSLPPTIFGENR